MGFQQTCPSMGLPGAGKTTLSNALAPRVNGPRSLQWLFPPGSLR